MRRTSPSCRSYCESREPCNSTSGCRGCHNNTMRETIIVTGSWRNAGFRHAAQNHPVDADHNSDDGGRFRTDGWAGVTRDIKDGQTSFRTQLEKKNDRDIDRAYQSSFKRIPDAKQKNSDPWGDARSAPPAAGKNKQSRIVSGEKTVSCNADEVLVSVFCSEGSPDGAGCSAGSPTGLCMHK